MTLKNKKLALFFTCGTSLRTWEKIGNLDREIKPYDALSKHFGKIFLITYDSRDDIFFKNTLANNIAILPKKYSFLPSKVYQLFVPFIYRKDLESIDIYKTNQVAAVIPAFFAKMIYKKKLVVRCGYEWLFFLEKQNKPFWKRKLVYFIEKIAYKTADRIIVTSQNDKQYIAYKFKILPSKINVISNYIDIHVFKPFNIPKEKNRIIFVGRLEEQKNLSNLIEGIRNLPVKLFIFGDGSLKEQLKNLAHQLNSDVEFMGNIPNNRLPEELNKSEIFMLPSLYEGCPKALLEAMACALPCIATNVRGIKEIIRHEDNAYLCETDADSIKRAILIVLHNKELQEKIGRNARQTIIDNFSFENILEKELAIYETL
jgi:glycosyltransferase involved in cell wall biosynthesis